jgi:uncharacterized protein (UPF0332 family)
MKEFALVEWQRACQTLEAARELVTADPDSAASRAYYAAFHALTSLFALRNRSFSKHKALRAALHSDLVHSGQWSTELGQAFDFLMEIRETGDYGGLVRVSKADALIAINKAALIVDAVKSACPELE